MVDLLLPSVGQNKKKKKRKRKIVESKNYSEVPSYSIGKETFHTKHTNSSILLKSCATVPPLRAL
jgi:hypothetical protein